MTATDLHHATAWPAPSVSWFFYIQAEQSLASAYARHVRNVENGRRTVFGAYGAVGPKEFFAVVVEAFFERPASLKHEEAEIYQQLANLFQLEPICWR